MASAPSSSGSFSSPAPGLLGRHRPRGATAAPAASFPRRLIGGGRARVVLARTKRYKGTAMREEKLAEMIEKKVAEAMEACGDESGGKDSEGCRVAWDEVEEVSQAKADLRRRLAHGGADPLEPYCQAHPDTDECSVYDDGDDRRRQD